MQPTARQFTTDEWLSAALTLVLGLAFIAGGLWVRAIEAREQARLVETTGTVVDAVSRWKTDSRGTRMIYAPVVEFHVTGDPARFTGTYQDFRLSNGQTLIVRYDPDDPADTARVVDPLESLTAWAMFVMGGFILISGLLPVVREWLKGGSAAQPG